MGRGQEAFPTAFRACSLAARRTALSPLAQWAGFAEQGATTMESSARLQGEYIADARKKMPEVVPGTTEKEGTAP